MTLRLLLIRHGLSSFNLENRIQGRSDLSVLTDQGKAQAIATGKALCGVPINAIYSSPLKRAAASSENILKGLQTKLKPIFDEGLLEVDLAQWSGYTIKELKENHPEAYKVWEQNPNDLEITNEAGDTYKPIHELMIQAKDFIQRLILKHPPGSEENIIIVAHNAILRCIVLVLLGEPKKGFRRIKLDNSSLSVINLIYQEKNNYTCQIECLNNTNHLRSSLPPKGKRPRLILVRHGETDWNLQGRFQGQIDIPLNINGQEQAIATKNFLKKEKINKAYASSLSRPILTAKIILKSHPDIEVELVKELIEISHGEWEGKLESEIKERWPELLRNWKDKPETVQMPEGESIEDVWGRSIESWNNICNKLKDGDTALIVAHDAVNKTILCHLLGLMPRDIWNIKQGNGGVSVIDIASNDRQTDVVTCLNLTSHLGNILDCTAAGAL